jgi:hypothetical protein
MKTIADFSTFNLVPEPFAIGVIYIDDGNFRGVFRKQSALGLIIGLHIPVIIQVVMGQVCEDRGMKITTGHTPLVQGMG